MESTVDLLRLILCMAIIHAILSMHGPDDPDGA